MAKWSNEKMADLTRKLADTAIEQNELYQAVLRDAKEAEAYAEELEAKLAKVISLADAMAEAIEYQIDTCDASMDEQAAVKNYRTTLAELTGGKDE